MHFVTEMELRDQYRKQAFSEFILNESDRLTPEAKQFLIDKQIKFMKSPKESLPVNEEKQLIDYRIPLLRSECLECARLANEVNFEISQKLFELSTKVTLDYISLNEFEGVDDKEYQTQLTIQHILSSKGELLIKLDQLIYHFMLVKPEIINAQSAINYFTTELIQIMNQVLGVEKDG